MFNRAVEHNVAVFSEPFLCCTLAGKASTTTSNSANLTASC